MRPRDESAHPLVEHALEQGYLDTQAVYHVDGLAGHDIANKARLSLNRAGQHLNVSTPSWVVDSAGEPCWKSCQDPQAPHGLRFRVHSKDAARQHLLRETGGDPSKLKYNPFKRGQRALVDDSGRPV